MSAISAAVKDFPLSLITEILGFQSDGVDIYEPIGCKTVLREAIDTKNTRMVEFLVNTIKLDVDRCNEQADNCDVRSNLHEALFHIQRAEYIGLADQTRYMKIFTTLLNQGASIQIESEGRPYCEETPFVQAIREVLRRDANHLGPLQELVQELLDRGANQMTEMCHLEDQFWCSPLHFAIYQGNEKIVRMILANAWMKKENRKEHVQKLLSQTTFDMNHFSKSLPYSPLNYAILYGHEKIVSVLLENGASQNEPSRKGIYTPLYHAVYKGQTEIVKLLLKQGANTEQRESYLEMTPLLSAVKQGNQEIVRSLLEQKADTEQKDRDGKTPLMIAIKNKNEEVIRMLLDAHAEIKEVE